MSQSLMIIMTATPLGVGVLLAVAALVVGTPRLAPFLMASAFALILASPLPRGATSAEALPPLLGSLVETFAYQGLVVFTFLAAFSALIWGVSRRDERSVKVADPVAKVGRVSETRHLRMRRLLKREHQKLASATQMQHYLELATRNSQITVFLQNADLEYLWIVNPRLGFSPEEVIGKSDYVVLPDEAQPLVIGHKRRAMATGSTQTFEIELVEASDKAWIRVDVVPITEEKGAAAGVVQADSSWASRAAPVAAGSTKSGSYQPPMASVESNSPTRTPPRSSAELPASPTARIAAGSCWRGNGSGRMSLYA